MATNKGKKDTYTTGIIIILAVAGILYFGYKAISDNMRKDGTNPFEYNIENFKQTDTSLIVVSTTPSIQMLLPR